MKNDSALTKLIVSWVSDNLAIVHDGNSRRLIIVSNRIIARQIT